MRFLITYFLVLFLFTPLFSQVNTTYQSDVKYTPSLNDVWGYAANGREYALVGLRNAVNIQDVTDPANPIDLGSATGPASTWRDMKTFGSYAYVTNDTNGGILIIDLSNLPNALTASDWSYWNPPIADLGGGQLQNCHNLYIDEFGYCYLAGCNLNNGGIIYLDLFTTPGTPIYVDKGPNVYAHDVYTSNNKMYASEIWVGVVSIYDVSDKSNTDFVNSQSTPNTFTHNAWTGNNETVVYTTDERANAWTVAYDISDPLNIQELDRFRPLATEGTGVFPHNVHVLNDFLVISHYSDGVVIVDASVPSNLIEVGNYDTCDGNCSGAWGAYPFLPSGNILVSDINEGLFVLSPNYVRAARLHGNITDITTGATIFGATVTLNSSQANGESSDLSGDYKTGLAASGTYTVTISKAGYTSQTHTVVLTNGVITTLDVQLGELSLPVDLVSFEAELLKENVVQLDWSATADEAYVDFEIERSTDAKNFDKIYTQRAYSLFEEIKAFSYIDEDAPIGKVYYRIKLLSPDGEFSYTPVKTIENLASKNVFTVFPNPVNTDERLSVLLNSKLQNSTIEMQVFNSTGRMVDRVAIGEEGFVYNLNNYPSGIYLLNFKSNIGVIQTERLVVR